MRFGADPEFTILDPQGKPVPAHLLGFGDKQNKHGATMYGRETFFRDGTNVEVNPAATICRGQLNKSLRYTVQQAMKMLPEGYTLTALPSYKLPKFKTTIKSAPDDVKYFGCEPWWNAYTGAEERSEVDAATHPLRYAGGHMHFGTNPGSAGHQAIANQRNHLTTIKLFDLFIGIPSVVLFGTADEFARRKVYGKAGEFRPQKYPNQEVGLEYRTPSPRIFNHPALVTLFFGVGRYVIENFAYLKDLVDKPGFDDVIQRAINTGQGVRALLTEVSGFYKPETILALKEVPDIYRFQLGTFTHDPETFGWTEYAAMGRWALPALR